MGWFEFLGATNTLISLMLTIVGSGIAFITWMYRRMRTIAKEANPVDIDTQRRVKEIEVTLDAVQKEVTVIDGRMNLVERRMETVATQRDVAEVKQELAGSKATLDVLKGMVDTIYQAAVRGPE